MLDGLTPKTLGLKDIISKYIDHQKVVIIRRTKFDLAKDEKRVHILNGYKIAQDNIDEVIKIIKQAKNDDEAKANLMERFGLDLIQSEAILELKLRRLTGLERSKIEEELASLLKEIEELKAILASEQKVLEIIKNEMLEIRNKYGDDRRTEIDMTAVEYIEDESLIPQEEIIVTLTNKNYIKRIPKDTYKVQHRGGVGIKGMTTTDNDFVEQLISLNTHDDILFFTNKGKVYRLKGYKIPEYSRTAKGLPIVNLLNFEQNEKLAAVLNVNMEKLDDGYFIFATRQGIVKKTEISAFANIRTNGIRAILLNEGDELFEVGITDGEKDIILGSSNGKAIRFSETDIRPMGRISAGVRGLLVSKGEKMVGMAIVNTDGDEIVIVTEKGYGKRTNVDAFRVQVRGGKGVKALNITEKNGKMISLSTVRGDEDLLMVTDKGMIIRTHLDQILTVGRDTQGVCIIKLNEGQSASSIAIVPRAEEEISEDQEYKEEFQYDEEYTFLDEENDKY